ncbi:GNAT family N-acetyltransferase [Terrimonas sp. NA20]|uniref:GNAT family N-acetyltransferase n=1 Tax=Terrimonas ginsenosidimutans TaxID=2908004 RepID=A0ABS9KM82_9BACT|nr:GNAT family N-acetyltransferase [Terrimonas ginsenosidimutans]MCG2613395.1 GNAT family N-acetyltransferase [Terrimonas ginsenosidimutans]
MIQLYYEQVDNSKNIPYDLLLLADETIEAINKYVFGSEFYLVKNDHQLIGAFCLSPISRQTIELKNIAVLPEFQRKGIGSIIIGYIKEICLTRYPQIIVGTPDSAAAQIQFYEKNGFKRSGVRKDFFIQQYDEPIYEDGIQLRDMLLLTYKF